MSGHVSFTFALRFIDISPPRLVACFVFNRTPSSTPNLRRLLTTHSVSISRSLVVALLYGSSLSGSAHSLFDSTVFLPVCFNFGSIGVSSSAHYPLFTIVDGPLTDRVHSLLTACTTTALFSGLLDTSALSRLTTCTALLRLRHLHCFTQLFTHLDYSACAC